NSDINFDGSLDLFIANRNKFTGDNVGYNYILKNIPNGNSWISIKCKGTVSNSMAIGSKIKVKANINGKDCWQLREINSISGFASQNSYRVHFGLGDATTIDSLIIIWSSGYVWDTTNVQVNQFLTISEEGIFRISTDVNNENLGSVSGEGLYSKDSLVVLKAKPFGGNYFVNWIENGTVVSTDSVYSFIATSPRTLVANFKSYFDEVAELTLVGIESGNLKWVDFDADGDLDISIIGHNYPDYLFKLYKNRGDGAFEEVSGLNIPGLFAANFAWNDIDGDNLIDLLIMGVNESSEYISKLFKNLGSGQFEEIAGVGLPGVYNGKCSLEDLNKDGLPDVILQGFDISGFSKLFIYKNIGRKVFQKVNHNIVDSIYVTNYVCEDLNKDGYPDIIISTYDNSPPLRTYYNKGNFIFQRIDNNGIISKSPTSMVLRDFNNDGKMDFVSSGYDKLNNVSTKVFYNQNDTLFIDDTSAFLPYVNYGGLTSCDVDNNGWSDIVISDNYLDKAPIYSNNGDSSFTVRSSLPKIDRGKISWGDYNNDGRMDVLLSRHVNSGYITGLYRQSLGVINSKPNAISNLRTTFNLNTVVLNWDKTTDAETSQDGLSYNLYIYNVDSSKYVISPNAKVDGESNNGERFVAELGNVRYNSNGFVINLPKGNYKWSVQAIDGALEGGPFAMAQTFSIITNSIEVAVQPEYSGVVYGAGKYTNGEDVVLVADPYAGATFINWTEGNEIVSTNDTLVLNANRDRNLVANFQTSFCQQEFNLIANKFGDINWIDFDGDGDLDLSFADKSGGIDNHLIIYRNDDNDRFTLIEPSGIVAEAIINLCWTDYNGDNKLDLFVTAYNSGNYNGVFYLGNGNGVFTKLDGFYFDPLTNNSICKIVDVNNDGFLDVFISGSLPEDPNNRKTYLYINRMGTEFIRNEPLLVGYTDAIAEWMDFDNDGDLDLIIAGTGNYPIATYKNDGEGNMSLWDNTFGYWVDCSFAAADFNNDGWIDIVCSGRISSLGFKNKLLLNDGTGHFIEQELSDESVRSNPDISTIDYDNDGFTDFYITGLSSDYSEKLTTIYKNVDGVSFVKQPGAIITPFANTRFSWGDYNSDGKIDLVLSGTIGSNYATKVYKNYTPSINTKPTKLTNLSSTVIDQSVSFKWNKGSDEQTPQDALTYNLYIYNVDSSKYLISPLAKVNNETDNGKRFISSQGFITFSSSGYSVELPKGNYKWSVQAIDGGLMGGDFAEEKSFIVNTTEINSSLSNELIEIFPNPTSDHIFINSEVECNLIVTDIVGKTCFECKINLGKYNLDLFDFRPGMYLFKFKYENQTKID
ncbi:MAG: T9SS type A sorting domain-containing protein, partial [Bacteroidales bacterium]